MNSISTLQNPARAIALTPISLLEHLARLRKLAVFCLFLLLAASVWGLTPAPLIGVNGSPAADGKIRITIGTDSIDVDLTAGMNCQQICDAIKTAAASGSEAWKGLEIECINDGGCYIRLRRKDGGHVAQPKVKEELDGIDFDHPILKDSSLKISGITAPPPMTGGQATLWTNCITISVNGNPRSYCVTVDNDPATGPGSQPAKFPTTPQEIADEFRKKIAEDPDLAANTNNDAQVFVFIEGRVTALDLGPANFPYAGENQPYRHALTIAVRPNSGLQTEEHMVQVHGSGLGPNAEIFFGGQSAKVLEYDPAQDAYTVVVPPSPVTGPVDVVAIPPGGLQDEFNTLPAGFEYLPDCRLSMLYIVQQPLDMVVFAGQTVTFTVAAEGTPPPNSYQWQWFGPGSEPFTNIPPVTGASLTITASAMDNGAQIRCVVGNGCFTVVSAPATLTVLPSPVQHDFTAEGLGLRPLGGGVYEIRPRVGIAAGPDALTSPLPLDFLVLVNGVVRHDGRGANTLVRSTCDDEDNCAGGCWVAVNGERRVGRCEGARGNCGCNVSTALAAVLMPLSPGDVVQFVLDPDQRVAELDEANNSFAVSVPPGPAAHDFAALGLELMQEGNSGLYRVIPRIGVRSGPGQAGTLPLACAVLVNGESRHQVQTIVRDVHTCPSQDCAGNGCIKSIGNKIYDGICDSGCGCAVTAALDSFSLSLAPGDVVQFVVDSDQLVAESDESNNTFVTTVANHAPVLARIPNQAVHAGTLIQFTIPAHDLDAKQTLTFTLEGGPDGAAIDPVTGEFRWQTTAAHVGASNLVVVRVSDSGQPALSDFQDFFISVAPPAVIVGHSLSGDSLELTWTSVPGNTYRIESTDDLSSPRWTELEGNLSAQDTLASWTLTGLDALRHRYFRIGLVAAVNVPVGVPVNVASNNPAWTCCERDIQFVKTGKVVKIDTGASTGLTNNNTRRFVTVDLAVPLEYNCANVPDQKCLADLAAKVVFRPRQDDGSGQFTQDSEEEIVATIVKTPEDAPPCVTVRRPHSMKVIIRWRGTYKATRHVKGTLNLELSVPGAKGAINHKLDVDIDSGRNAAEAKNPVLNEIK